MTPKPLIIIPILILTSIFILLLLVTFSARPNERPNGFNRRWENWKTDSVTSIEQNGSMNEICGVSERHIYFTTQDPRWIVRLNNSLHKKDSIAFGLPYSAKMLGASTTIVEAPAVYFFSNNFPGIFRGKWDVMTFDTLHLPSTTFTRATRFPPNNAIIRAFDPLNTNQQILQKINLESGKITASNSLFSDQTLGGFDKDGILAYDSIFKQIFYIEQYRNKVYCLDTSLNLKYTFNTIDTFAINPVEIKWVTMDGEKKLMPSKPRTVVNTSCFVSDTLLYIQSQLKSDNEDLKTFKKNIPFDVYSTFDGTYKGSFRISNSSGDALLSFSIHRDLLVILRKKHIQIYKIHLNQ